MPEDMHPEEIKARIRIKGRTLTRLARISGIAPSTIRRSIRVDDCPTAERVIAEYLGLDPHSIWPSRYDKNGRRRNVKTKTNCRASGRTGHRQKRKAA